MKEKLKELERESVKISITSPYYHGDTWDVRLTKTSDEVNLEIVSKEDDPETALEAAYRKYRAVVSKGIPDFKGPLLEHRPVPPAPSNPDDEIPF